MLQKYISKFYPKGKVFLSYESFSNASPFRQGLSVFLVAALTIIIWGNMSADEGIEWFVAVTALGFYIWLNILVSFFSKAKWLGYIGKSFLVLLLLSVGCLLLANQVATTSFWDFPEYQTMLVLVFIFYILGLMVAALIKNVAEVMGIHY